MTISKLSKAIGIGALSLSLSVLPLTLPASAQTGPSVGDSTTTTGPRNDVNFDWGWLGLLGLIGLAGLGGRSRHTDEPTRYRDPRDPSVTPPGYRE
jgi:MYXO-CTERM domain-containing protein